MIKHKTLPVKMLLVIILISLISTNCEHCDDEDYQRDQKENTNLKHSDSTTLHKSDRY